MILRLYQSPAEVLAGFDVDCACVLYDGKFCILAPLFAVSLSHSYPVLLLVQATLFIQTLEASWPYHANAILLI